jgi:hypothetical protein
MCLYVLSFVLWYPLQFPHRNDVRIVFTSSCLWEGSCLIYVICICLGIVVSNTYNRHIALCFCFLCLRLVYPMLSVSLTFIWHGSLQKKICRILHFDSCFFAIIGIREKKMQIRHMRKKLTSSIKYWILILLIYTFCTMYIVKILISNTCPLESKMSNGVNKSRMFTAIVSDHENGWHLANMAL